MALIVRPPALFEAIHALKAFRPDYVARLGDKVIVGEVKSKERVSSGADLQALGSVVNSIPGWRLELIWLGDEPDALPTSDDVERVVERARTVAQVDEAAALLLAWAGVEAAVERLSSQVGLGLRRGTPAPTHLRVDTNMSLADRMTLTRSCRNSSHPLWRKRSRKLPTGSPITVSSG